MSATERMACAGILLCAGMGVRPQELENVGKPGTSIDWDARLIYGIGVKTKTGREREVLIPEEIVEIAKTYLVPINAFANITRTGWQYRLDKLCESLQIPRRTLGAGRSTYMTRMYQEGVKERDVQKLVGHVVGSATLAKNYLKLENEALKSEVDRVITFGKQGKGKDDSLDALLRQAREQIGDERLKKILQAQI